MRVMQTSANAGRTGRCWASCGPFPTGSKRFTSRHFAMNPRLTRIGGLDAAVLDSAADPQLLVVLCHGFGAPGDDLVPLAPEIVRVAPALAASTRFVFPAAPLSLGDMGHGEARAWWPIDFVELAHAARGGPE